MKKVLWLTILILALSGVACGGGGAEAPAAPVAEEPAAQTAEESAAEPVAPTEAPAEANEASEPGEAEAEAPADAEAAGDAAAGDGAVIAGRPASGIDPDTNLEVNPPTVVPGVDFIVRGEIVNANLTPQESPEFVILAPSGTRFRIRSQQVSDIVYEDGTVPALHEFQRGVLVQATVRQEEDAGATITVQSNDLTLLHPTE